MVACLGTSCTPLFKLLSLAVCTIVQSYLILLPQYLKDELDFPSEFVFYCSWLRKAEIIAFSIVKFCIEIRCENNHSVPHDKNQAQIEVCST